MTAASDIFSFGGLVFKVLTGRTPFAGNTLDEVLESIRTRPPPFLREVAVGVPEDLQAICLACLSRDPAHRPTAKEVALDLGRFLAGEPVRAKPKLYDDLLRQQVSEFSRHTHQWQGQNMISRDERDSIEVVHRRILADEDEWIIDARRITRVQTVLYGAAWLSVYRTCTVSTPTTARRRLLCQSPAGNAGRRHLSCWRDTFHRAVTAVGIH